MWIEMMQNKLIVANISPFTAQTDIECLENRMAWKLVTKIKKLLAGEG